MHKLVAALLIISAVFITPLFITQGRATSVLAGETNLTQANSSASDCFAQAKFLPPGTTRVYIALRNGRDGSGSSMADARDGSTVSAFDTILRCYSEGCTDAQNP